MPPEQHAGGCDHNDGHKRLINVYPRYHGCIQAQEIKQETTQRINDQINQKDIPWFKSILETAANP